MHLHSRLLLGLTTVLATVAITVPAHAAEHPRPKQVEISAMTVAAELAQMQRQLDSDIENASIREIKREAGQAQLGRRRYHCNRLRCWWTQWIGPGHYVVVKYTWTGTWYLKRKTESANAGFEASQILCSFISPWCGAFTWAIWTYWKAMLNRAIENRRCLVTLSKTFGIGLPAVLRTARCSR
jgi:hypothetical protein